MPPCVATVGHPLQPEVSVLADAVHTIGPIPGLVFMFLFALAHADTSKSDTSARKMFMGKMAAGLAAAVLMLGMLPMLAAPVATAGPCDPGTMGPDPRHPFPACEDCARATLNDPYHRACYGGAPASVPPRNTPPPSTVPVQTAQAPPPTYAPPSTVPVQAPPTYARPSTVPVQAAPPPAPAPAPAPAAAPPPAPVAGSPLCSGADEWSGSHRFYCAYTGGADSGKAPAPAPAAAAPAAGASLSPTVPEDIGLPVSESATVPEDIGLPVSESATVPEDIGVPVTDSNAVCGNVYCLSGLPVPADAPQVAQNHPCYGDAAVILADGSCEPLEGDDKNNPGSNCSPSPDYPDCVPNLHGGVMAPKEAPPIGSS